MTLFKKFIDSFKIFRQEKTLRRKFVSNFKKLARAPKVALVATLGALRIAHFVPQSQ